VEEKAKPIRALVIEASRDDRERSRRRVLVLTHVSPRYEDSTTILEDAKKVFRERGASRRLHGDRSPISGVRSHDQAASLHCPLGAGVLVSVMLTLPMSAILFFVFLWVYSASLNLPLAEGFFLALLVGWLAFVLRYFALMRIEIEDTGMVVRSRFMKRDHTPWGFLRIRHMFGPFFYNRDASHFVHHANRPTRYRPIS